MAQYFTEQRSSGLELLTVYAVPLFIVSTTVVFLLEAMVAGGHAFTVLNVVGQ